MNDGNDVKWPNVENDEIRKKNVSRGDIVLARD